MIVNPTIIAKPKIELREKLSQGIFPLESFDIAVVQYTPHILIYSHFHLLPQWLSHRNVVWWPKWMPWIPLFWVLAMVVVQCGCFAISFASRIVYYNILPMSIRLCWIRGTHQIRILQVYSFFVWSLFRWWHIRYIVCDSIISWLPHWYPFRFADWSQTMVAPFD